jgi:hypothetical protein
MTMYLPIPTQPDCATAWREAVRAVLVGGHEAQNVVIDIADPLAGSAPGDPVVACMNAFLESKGRKPVETVANTLFPAALYRRYGAPAFYERFMTRVLPAAGRGIRWSGYYFERMINLHAPDGSIVNQLADITDRLADPKVTARNKFELSIFDPVRDVSRVSYGGQCLSHASFKLRKSPEGDQLDLTVMYRNHFYVEKLLGNLIGLGRLMAFIAKEGGVKVGSLTVISTHACIDLPESKTDAANTTTAEVRTLLAQCDALVPG